MIDSYLATGDIAPMILFANGPASNPFNSGRDALYGWGYTPTFQVDGSLQRIGWSQSIVEGLINERLSVPSYLEIAVDINGDATGGIATYTLTAEQDLGAEPLKLYSAIVESGDIASSSYGYYAGQELHWEPRVWPAGATGTVVEFTGPYPQTVIIEKPYNLNPTIHNFENLDIVTAVQLTSGNHEVMNAHFMDVPDTYTGIYNGENIDAPEFSLSNNPSSGIFSIYTALPTGTTGNFTIYDTNGRILDQMVSQTVTPVRIEETGVYFIHLVTNSGGISVKRCTVIK